LDVKIVYKEINPLCDLINNFSKLASWEVIDFVGKMAGGIYPFNISTCQ
jgi:hypothetical protein